MTGYYSEWKMQSLLNQPVGASSHVSVLATGQTDRKALQLVVTHPGRRCVKSSVCFSHNVSVLILC